MPPPGSGTQLLKWGSSTLHSSAVVRWRNGGELLGVDEIRSMCPVSAASIDKLINLSPFINLVKTQVLGSKIKLLTKACWRVLGTWRGILVHIIFTAANRWLVLPVPRASQRSQQSRKRESKNANYFKMLAVCKLNWNKLLAWNNISTGLIQRGRAAMP